MTKRAFKKFKRNPKDFYATPPEAVLPLLPFLDLGQGFIEPCAGDGALVAVLQAHGLVCVAAGDIAPRAASVMPLDALSPAWDWHIQALSAVPKIITNPPWSRDVLHQMIERFRGYGCWLLFDADWMHTRQAAGHLIHCSRIVSVGRVSWMGNGVSGFDNCAWYEFGPTPAETVFYPRFMADVAA